MCNILKMQNQETMAKDSINHWILLKFETRIQLDSQPSEAGYG